MPRQIPERVQQRLDNLPDSPGCYLMKNSKGKVIYVGKAIVLRNRVRSYFHSSAQHHPKTAALVQEIEEISWWVTSNELEALMLESELIKQYQPHYNIRLKDDKSFPYIKINWQSDYPKVAVVRKIVRDGARYFGPYTSGRASYTTLEALRRIFPYLDCDREITGNDARPCLYYHIKLCGGPCIGAQNREEYRATIQQLMDFLNGNSDKVVAQLKRQMERAAENLQFELAATYRDRHKAAQLIAEQQKIVSTVAEDVDYVAISLDERTGDTAVQVFIVRNGRLIGRENFMLEGVGVGNQESKAQSPESKEVGAGEPETDSGLQTDAGALIGEFMQQFYSEASYIPKLIMVQALPPDAPVLSEWLSKQADSKVEVRVPQRGSKLKLMQLAMQNAAEYLRLQQAEWASDTNRQTNAISELQEALGLVNPPARIECYDISTLQGTNTVGSMVVFAKGAPLKSAYRRFKIKGKGNDGAPDDFASMREMLRRRFKRIADPNTDPEIDANGSPEAPFREGSVDQSSSLQTPFPEDEAQSEAEADNHWKILPDLIIIDGGKGQLGVAVEVLEEYGLLDRLPIVGLAKREEEIFFPRQSNPLWLKRGSQALHLVQRVRDEAHRFGVTFHRKLRSKAQTKSKLDDVPGIGPARRKALMKYFAGDVDRMRRASLEELQAVPGINRKAAEAIKSYL